MFTGVSKLDLLGWITFVSIALVTFMLIIGCKDKQAEQSANRGGVAISSDAVNTPTLDPVVAKAELRTPQVPPASPDIDVPAPVTAKVDDPKVDDPQENTEPAKVDSYAHYLKGLEYRNQGEYEKATKEFAEVIKASPSFWKAYVNLARTQLKQSKPTEAVESCNKALKLRDDAADIYNVRGVGFLDQGLYQEAISDFEKAISLDPKRAWPHNNLALTHLRLGKLDEAVKGFQLAVELSPQTAIMHNNLAAALEKLGRFDVAKKEYEAALALEPDYAKAKKSLARVTPLINASQKQVAVREPGADDSKAQTDK